MMNATLTGVVARGVTGDGASAGTQGAPRWLGEAGVYVDQRKAVIRQQGAVDRYAVRRVIYADPQVLPVVPEAGETVEWRWSGVFGDAEESGVVETVDDIAWGAGLRVLQIGLRAG